MPVVDYSTYANFVKSKVESGDISNFKSHPDYTYMLEHVSYELGTEYLKCLMDHTSISIQECMEFCTLNDSQGNPTMYSYTHKDVTFTCSPTSLRYLYHAHLILTHYESLGLPNINIVEIGGGYGGLFLAVQYLRLKYRVALESYTIIDLPEINALQKLYIENVPHSLQVDFVDATTYGKDIQKPNMCLISCYCFSEIDYTHQSRYIISLFPRIIHGFIAWNHIPTYNFGFKFREVPEIPLTAAKFNKYVYF
jgi:hypothetical protein